MRRKYYLLKYLIAALIYACLYQGTSEAAVRSSSKTSGSGQYQKLDEAAVSPVTSGAAGKMIGKVQYQNRSYYVFIHVQGNYASIWFRVKPDMSTRGDIKVMEITALNFSNIEAAKKAICRAKSTYDNSKALLGCGATIGSGICVATAAPSAGGSLLACQAVISYTASKGLADCIDGVSGAIANYLGKGADWDRMRMGAKIATGQWAEAIDKAIDIACADVPNK